MAPGEDEDEDHDMEEDEEVYSEVGDEDDEEEDDERPFTRGEIVKKTLRGLEAREKQKAETREKQLTKL